MCASGFLICADDDTFFFASGYKINDVFDDINKEIAKIYVWIKAHKLPLNIDKTNVMLITPKYVNWSIKGKSIDWNRIMEVMLLYMDRVQDRHV